MTQLSRKRRERRRQRWYEEELPTLLVRLRLVASPQIVDHYRACTWTKRETLRRLVNYHESLNQPRS